MIATCHLWHTTGVFCSLSSPGLTYMNINMHPFLPQAGVSHNGNVHTGPYSQHDWELHRGLIP